MNEHTPNRVVIITCAELNHVDYDYNIIVVGVPDLVESLDTAHLIKPGERPTCSRRRPRATAATRCTAGPAHAVAGRRVRTAPR